MRYSLSDVCFYVNEQIPISKIKIENYISTENMLPEKSGIQIASSLPNTQNVRHFKKNDILVSNIRPYFKKIWFAEFDGGCSADILVFRPLSNKISSEFLFELLSQDAFFNYVMHTSKGTKMPRGDKHAIMNFEFEMLDRKSLEFIGTVGSNLYLKIKNNKQMITNLEEIASTLFKHWFVEFEFPDENGNPYKSSGGKMVESEIGEIPEGWELIKLGNLVTIIDNRGKTPPLEKEKTQYPIIDVKALTGESILIDYTKCSKFVNVEIYNTWFRNGHPKENDILLSTVGSIGQMKIFKNDIGAIAQNVVALRSNNISPYYLFEYLKFIKQDLVAYNIGSVQPSIKVTHIIKHDILVPNEHIISIFNSTIKDIVSYIVEQDKNANILTGIRDSLIPKLLSGDIELPIEEEV